MSSNEEICKECKYSVHHECCTKFCRCKIGKEGQRDYFGGQCGRHEVDPFEQQLKATIKVHNDFVKAVQWYQANMNTETTETREYLEFIDNSLKKFIKSLKRL